MNYLLFRGTNKYEIDRYNETNKFYCSKGYRHYLGSGIYFFRDDEKEAENWAKYNIRKDKEDSIFVIKLILDLEEDEVFDLLKVKDRDQYIKLLKYFEERFKNEKEIPDIKKPYDGYIIDYYCSMNRKIKLVSAVFDLKNDYLNRLSEEDFTRINKHHIQVCIKRKDIIKNENVTIEEVFL
jgi:hypothetical protein